MKDIELNEKRLATSIVSVRCNSTNLCKLLFLQAIFMIPTKPPPTFKNADEWTPSFVDFIAQCLVKKPEDRKSSTELLEVSIISGLC